MSRKILVSAPQLNELIEKGQCLVVDCRFDLEDSGRGRADWLAGHIPGAWYAHLDDDLAAPIEDHTGRHPLPRPEAFASYLAAIGWTPEKQLVAYDAGPGAIASRLWWLMRYFGQPAALLDGGLQAWIEAGFHLEAGENVAIPAPVEPLVPDQEMAVDTADISNGPANQTLVDARAAERYAGEFENLDTRAGHIPGALNRPFADNLAADERFKNPGQLRREFETLLRGRDAGAVVHSCGSGVTACHNLFAMELAGLGQSRLYPGSWSEWIRDPRRPIASGY